MDINKELEEAVNKGNLEEVKALLSAGANANHRVEWQTNTLLHITYSVEIAKELILNGAEVNARNMFSEIPLRSAITEGKKLELVRELLKHGADVNATDRNGNTAVNNAVIRGGKNLGVIKELLEYGADITIGNLQRRLHEDCFTSLDEALTNFYQGYGKLIDLSPYKGQSNYRKISSYLKDCVCEIFQMKIDEIKDGLPLYEFVKDNFDEHLLYNNQLSVRVAKIDYSKRYPIYNDIILDKVKPFLERADLLNKLSKIQFYTKLDMTDRDVKEKIIILDHDSTYNITNYLSNDNLLNLIVAFDSSNKRAFQSLSSSNNLIEPGKRLNETSISNDTKRARFE